VASTPRPKEEGRMKLTSALPSLGLGRGSDLIMYFPPQETINEARITIKALLVSLSMIISSSLNYGPVRRTPGYLVEAGAARGHASVWSRYWLYSNGSGLDEIRNV
jgi:hypothetical protein